MDEDEDEDDEEDEDEDEDEDDDDDDDSGKTQKHMVNKMMATTFLNILLVLRFTPTFQSVFVLPGCVSSLLPSWCIPKWHRLCLSSGPF